MVGFRYKTLNILYQGGGGGGGDDDDCDDDYGDDNNNNNKKKKNKKKNKFLLINVLSQESDGPLTEKKPNLPAQLPKFNKQELRDTHTV